jgi:hypothetical protein
MTNPSQPDKEPRYEYPARATPRQALRASDKDREQIAADLRHAAAEGRLRVEELEQRLAAAFSSMTYGELDRVVSDLPRPRPPGSSLVVARGRRWPRRALVAAAAAVALLVAGALGAVGVRHHAVVAACPQRMVRPFGPGSPLRVIRDCAGGRVISPPP